MKKISPKYKKSQKHRSSACEGSTLLKSALGTLLLTLAVGGGALLLSSFALTFAPDPLSLALPAGLLCAALVAFVGGFFATRVYHLPTLGAGLVAGILITALSLLCSLLFLKNASSYATGYSAALSAILHVVLVAISIGGAFWGARERTAGKKKRKKKR